MQVWEYKIEPSLKCRVKDTFVQWQAKGPDGPVSHGMRLKSAEVAQKVKLTESRLFGDDVAHPRISNMIF